MPFTGFRCRFFYISSKSYHTIAKQSPTAFFDSSFNYIKQNSQLVSFETLSQNAGKKFPNPHPSNSATSNYLQLDFNNNNIATFQDDENNNALNLEPHKLKNPLNIMLPLNQGHVILSINSYQLIHQKLPNVDLNKIIKNTKRSFNTKQFNSDKIIELREEKPEVLKFYQPSIEDELPPKEQNAKTFLLQQTSEIETAFKLGQFEKINSIYMAIKRNNLIPSLETYELILKSICLRTIDDSLDDKLSILLNVYQDLIQQKLKPNCEIYSIIINELLQSSINSSINPKLSTNGGDFFKIAIDIFNASNCLNIQQYDLKIIEKILIGMNFYPGLINHKSLIEILSKQNNFVKNSIYYTSLINYCKFTQDSKMAISLYEEFKVNSLNDKNLYNDQFKIYSNFISTLVSTGEIQLATKFLDRILTTIKNFDNYESKISNLLSSYLLSLSKINFEKSLEIWSQFNSIDWIPEFSYEFYSNFLNDSLLFNDYKSSLKLYNYMCALPRSSKPQTVENFLITPSNDLVLSEFLKLSIEKNDKSTVLKLIKESFIRNASFSLNIYPILFKYLNNEELIVKIINNHGISNSKPFEFLDYLTKNIPNLSLHSISKTLYFKKLINLYTMDKLENFNGFYSIFNSIFKQRDLSNDELFESIELLSPLVLEFHDLNNYYTEFGTHETIKFKNDLTQYYKSLINELDTKDEKFSNIAVDAINMI